MYTKCIQNVYKFISHFDKLLHTFCIQNQKNYASRIHTECIYKLLYAGWIPYFNIF